MTSVLQNPMVNSQSSSDSDLNISCHSLFLETLSSDGFQDTLGFPLTSLATTPQSPLFFPHLSDLWTLMSQEGISPWILLFPIYPHSQSQSFKYYSCTDDTQIYILSRTPNPYTQLPTHISTQMLTRHLRTSKPQTELLIFFPKPAPLEVFSSQLMITPSFRLLRS